LRDEQTPVAATVFIRGGPDTVGELRRHAERTARAWALDGRPFLGIALAERLDLVMSQNILG
jgi:hypothetical protein